MKFKIMSKRSASEFWSDERYAVIGVVSDQHPEMFEDYVDRLRLKFYDVDSAVDVSPPITKDDAIKILEFVEKNKDKVDFFVVHCNAGISRSSGIAAALSLIYNGTDKWVFDSNWYMPNMLVRRTILSEADKIGLLN